MRLTALALTAAASLGLAGCVSLFPESEPAQLYRFSGAAAAQPGPGAMSGQTPIAIAPLQFTAAASGDRIMTVTGSEVAYIAAARWASPASTQFSEALEQAFERQARTVTLMGHRGGRSARLVLDVDVNAFEARYENGREAAPTVVVSLDARLLQIRERNVVAHRVIEVRQPAGENRVSAIVQAMEAATGQALGQLVEWTDANAR